jgi:hypothetical protein
MAVETAISRRKLLKRAGIGGAAAVWSVPFLASSASADVGIETLRQACRSGVAPNCPGCASITCAQKNGTTCFCFPGIKGGISSACCECQGNYFCGGPTCSSNANCPNGFKCVNSCCGNTCAPKCGQGIANSHIGAGKTAAG